MPAKDIYNQVVKNALEKEGWTITDDPLYIRFLDAEMSIDLGAERLIAAEKQGKKIAVEIKSFLGSSLLYEFHEALGQYLDYEVALEHKQPDRTLYLAVPLDAYEAFFQSQFGQFAIERFKLKLIVYRIKSEEIVTWLH
jgi:hypothetical protein